MALDLKILELIIDNLRCPALNVIALSLSFLGGVVIWAAIAGGLCAFKKYRAYGIALIIAVLLALILSEFAIKPLIMRERPYIAHDLVLIGKAPYGSSFPSSHTAQCFAGAGALLGVKRVNRKFGIIAGVSAFIFAGLVGFSRVYLAVHYPSDALGGAVLGLIIAIISNKVLDKLKKT